MLKSIKTIAFLFLLLSITIAKSQCTADVGTYKTYFNNSLVTNFPIYIYPEEKFEIRSDNNFTLPTPVAGEVAELFIMVFDCPPTFTTAPDDDPCWSKKWWTGKDFTDFNNSSGVIIPNFDYGRHFFNTVTVDDGDDNFNPNDVTNIDNNGDDCYDYDLSQNIETYWLRDITAFSLNGCNDGSIRIVASGGLPEFDNDNSTYVITNNGNGTLSGLPASHNELFFIDGLSDGQTYSIHITDTQGKVSTTISGTYREINAGEDAFIVSCSDDAPFSLFSKLGGTPTSGGVWTNADGNAVSNTYTPGTGGGIFTYSVTHPNNPLCTISSQVEIVEYIGSSSTFTQNLTFCENEPSVDLFSLLNGTPSTGGQWLSPDGNTFDGTFDPSLNTSGTYTYNENSTNPCDGDTYEVTIDIISLPDAGDDATANFCDNDLPVNAYNSLEGTPDANGRWLSPNGDSFNGFLQKTFTNGTYIYIVESLPCRSDTAKLTVEIYPYSDEQYNTFLTFCETDNTKDVYFDLQGTPTPGGLWTDPEGNNFNGLLDPGTNPIGVYTYNNPTPNPCNFDNYTIDIQINTPPYSGEDVAISICDNNTIINGFDTLSGFPDPGGIWITPSGNLFDGQIIPSKMPEGIYKYVTSTFPCPSDTAELSLTVLESPQITLPKEINLDPGENYTFNTIASNYNPSTLHWSPTDYMINETSITPTVITDDSFIRENYTLSLENDNCKEEASTTITVLWPIAVPTGFTPNNDGINDTWEIDYLQLYPDATVTVFNRYGSIVYEGKGADNYWNGTRNGQPLPVGSYYFVIEINEPKVQKLNGIVTIVR